MLSPESAVAALARELDAAPPPAGVDGAWVFELDAGLSLGVEALPDGSALVAWSTASAAVPGESSAESEARAAAFLRAHLGRLRRSGPVAATRDEAGNGVLFIRAVPSTETEWLRAVENLLNETEAMRKILSDRSAPPSGGMSLFSGMAGLLRR